jgi:16S rRNA U516 pseudouridylate synthase RsuA-like enzyme
LAFGPLRSVFQVHELNALAETMAERGTRLRRGLEDMIEKNAVEADGQEDNESEDEIEHNARELRRLKPY